MRLLQNYWDSHSRVGWSTTSFRDVPIDVVLWHFDRAALAMQAVLGVDLQLWLTLLVFNVLINLSRAESLLWSSEFLD